MRSFTWCFALALSSCNSGVVLGPVDGSTDLDSGSGDGSIADRDAEVADGSSDAGSDGGLAPPCGVLGAPFRLEESDGPVTLDFDVANAGEDFVVAWSQQPGTTGTFQGWIARHDGSAWSAATSFTHDNEAAEFQLAFDASGDGVIAWIERPTADETQVWAAPSGAAGLGTAVQLGLAPRFFGVVDAAASSAGVIVGWLSDAPNQMRASRALGGSGFETSMPLSADLGTGHRNPIVAIDDEGDALALWGRQATGETVLHASRAPSGGAWDAESILSASMSRAIGVSLARLPDGAIAVWWEMTTGLVVSARYVEGSGWSAAEPLPSSGLSYDGGAELHLDASGRGYVIWSGSDAAGNSALSIGRFDPITGFEPGVPVPHNFQLALGATRSLATWIASGSSLEAACIDADGNWSASMRVSSAGQTVTAGIAAVAPSGRGVFVYKADDDLWAVTLD